MKQYIDVITPSTKRELLLRQLQINGSHESFHLVDLASVRNKLLEWGRIFPQVEPFFAMKCNPDPKIIQTLRVAIQ